MNVNMPNLNSATGSWILNFAEMRSSPAGPQVKTSDEIAEPAPLHKVESEISADADGRTRRRRSDLVRGNSARWFGGQHSGRARIDPLLDSNAVRSLAQWKFRPAERQGEPVDLEAIVHIPFHAPERQ